MIHNGVTDVRSRNAPFKNWIFVKMASTWIHIHIVFIILLENLKIMIVVCHLKCAQYSIFVLQGRCIVAENVSNLYLHDLIPFKHIMLLDQKVRRESSYNAVKIWFLSIYIKICIFWTEFTWFTITLSAPIVF